MIIHSIKKEKNLGIWIVMEWMPPFNIIQKNNQNALLLKNQISMEIELGLNFINIVIKVVNMIIELLIS